MEVIPEMTIETLETILTSLGDPKYASINLYTEYDYAAVLKQVKEVLGDIKVYVREGIKLSIPKPTKKNILDIYKTKDSMRIDKVEWKLPDAEITLTSIDMNITCDKVPDYIADLISKVKNDLFSINIKISARKYE